MNRQRAAVAAALVAAAFVVAAYAFWPDAETASSSNRETDDGQATGYVADIGRAEEGDPTFLGVTEAKATRSSAETSAGLQRVEQGLRQVLSRLTEIEARVDRLDKPPSGPSDDVIYTEEEIRRNYDQEIEEEARQTEAEHALFYEHHEAEQVDPAWAVETVDAIENAVASAPGDIGFVSAVDCRTTLCRIELPAIEDGRSNLRGVDVLRQKLMENSATAMSGSFYTDADGTVVMFLLRDGHDRPRP